MEKKIQIEDYIAGKGLYLKWENGFEITVEIIDGTVMISANKEGLMSLANHLLTLSQEGVPKGHHIHLDENNSLQAGSNELIITAC